MKQRVQQVFNDLGHELTDDKMEYPLQGYFKIDSLDRVELIIELEKEFDITIDDLKTEEFFTAQDILDYITEVKNG